MVQLVCPCLNIRIHGKGSAVHLRDSCDLKLSDRALADDFFSSQIYDVHLDLGGVTKAQKSLCTSRSIEGWVITSCLGCETEIYAKHLDDNDRVLVSCNIEKDPSRITTLMESENYSNLFKLLLPEINDNFVQNNLGVSYSNNDSFECALKHVQQQVSGFLKDEQKAMEERIRVFTEQQQSRFSALQQKVKKHKQSMLFLLLKRRGLKKGELCESLSPSSPVAITQHNSEDSSSSSDSANIQDKSHDFFMESVEQVPIMQLPPHRKPIRRLHSVNNPPQRSKVARPFKHNSFNVDVDDVFDMEGFETGDLDAPFYNSDDDDFDASSTEDGCHSKRGGGDDDDASKHCAGSLPISVPAWSRYSRYSIHDDDDPPVVTHRDPEQLAASFRALVQGSSVNDGTEIFGDLPRRRLNTGELVRSRPI